MFVLLVLGNDFTGEKTSFSHPTKWFSKKTAKL